MKAPGAGHFLSAKEYLGERSVPVKEYKQDREFNERGVNKRWHVIQTNNVVFAVEKVKNCS